LALFERQLSLPLLFLLPIAAPFLFNLANNLGLIKKNWFSFIVWTAKLFVEKNKNFC